GGGAGRGRLRPGGHRAPGASQAEEGGREVNGPEPAAVTAPTKQPPVIRAILLALGFDPDHDRAYHRRAPFAGLLVVDVDGRPVRFYTRRQLKELDRDESFRRE